MRLQINLKPDVPECGAELQGSGDATCGAPAGWQTQHPGEGPCWMHDMDDGGPPGGGDDRLE